MEGIGMLFEGLHPTTTRGFLWEVPDTDCGNAKSNAAAITNASFEWERRPMIQTQEHNHSANAARNNRVICAVIRCIDDHPGAVASGHYVWPSSLALCDYLVATCLHHPKSILELGSGCSGIASMVASQAFAPKMVVVTDHDPTALERARENHQATQKQLGCVENITRTEFLQLEWGSPSDWHALQECLRKNDNKVEMEKSNKSQNQLQSQLLFFDLVLGSDLIESTEVVEPLFSTVHAALEENHSNNNACSTTASVAGIFLMAQSFAYDSETEAAIDRACDRFGLVRRVVRHQKEESGSHGGASCDSVSYIKIEEFKRR